MDPSASSARFDDTRWSLVLRAGTSDDVRRREALGVLAATYWPPLYAFLRARGRSGEDAADLVQGVFAKLIAGESIASVEEEGGRFRNWLLTCLVHHERSVGTAARAQKRGGGAGHLSIDREAGEALFASLQATGAGSPEAVYEMAWARRVLEAARAQLEREHVARGRTRVFRALVPLLDGEDLDRAALARCLEMTPVALRVALHRLRDRFRELILAEVRETVGPDEDSSAELSALLEAVSGNSPDPA